MIAHSYPLRIILKTGLLLSAIVLLFDACRKDTEKVTPALQLETGSGFVADSAVVPIGFPYTIGISARKGEAAITNLVVTLTTDKGTETALDSGLYSNDFRYSRKISYGASRYEKWSFKLRDKNGKSATASLIIFRDTTSTFGPITRYSSVILTSQENSLHSSFFSVASGRIYTISEAASHPSEINIITYYGDQLVPSTAFTLSSPGESDVSLFYPMISGWQVPRNETRYKADSLSISPAEFDKAYNDSLIITNYTSATTGKRKFKMARRGYVIPFQLTIGSFAGKRGLILIRDMQPGQLGYIVADIQVQK